jgi:hypothetical protein
VHHSSRRASDSIKAPTTLEQIRRAVQLLGRSAADPVYSALASWNLLERFHSDYSAAALQRRPRVWGGQAVHRRHCSAPDDCTCIAQLHQTIHHFATVARECQWQVALISFETSTAAEEGRGGQAVHPLVSLGTSGFAASGRLKVGVQIVPSVQVRRYSAEGGASNPAGACPHSQSYCR